VSADVGVHVRRVRVVGGHRSRARHAWRDPARPWVVRHPRPWTQRPGANGSLRSTAASCCWPVSPRSRSPLRTSACIRPRSRTGTPTRRGSPSTSPTVGRTRRCTTRSAAGSSCATASRRTRPRRCRAVHHRRRAAQVV
jgi:hypothetical protein